jgi:ribosome-associated translation inhibitor RaiA
MTAGTAAANTKVVANDNEDTNEFMTLTAHTDEVTSSITYTIGLKGLHDAFDSVNDAIDAVDDKVDELSAATEDAIEQLAEKIEANEVSSTDGSIVVTPTTAGTDLSVNIDERSIVLNDNNELVADLKLTAVTPSGANVKEEYALIDHAGTQLGSTIKIYKDSSLYSVYLGHVDDTIASADDPTVVPGSGNTALCFIYFKADGTYELVAVDVESFLEESEFVDGLQVNNHVVSVKVDAASEKVKVDASGNIAPVLSVGPDCVKISDIQNAIDAAADELEERIEKLEEKASGVSVSEGTSVENFVTLNITNNESGATAVTINDSNLKDVIDGLNEAISAETAAREAAIEKVTGNSASTSAETSIMGVREYVDQVVSTLDADAVQEVEFAEVSEKETSAYGSNAGATVVPMEGEVGKKLVLDFSYLKIDCGEYE